MIEIDELYIVMGERLGLNTLGCGFTVMDLSLYCEQL